MKTMDIKVKNFTGSSYGIFEDGKFVTSNDGFDKMIDQATLIAIEGASRVSIATLKFSGTYENPMIEEGTVIMNFHKAGDTVYITNQLA